jgi:TP901 family phage tail tape measure protein
MLTGALFRLQVLMELADRVSGPAGAVAARIQAIESATLRAGAALERLQTATSLTAAGAALAAPLVLATGAAMRFEDAFADVRKVVDAPLPALQALQRELLALTRTIPMSAAELTQIAAAAGQAGIPFGELVRFTRDAARVGVAFGITAGEAGDALAKLRNVLELTQPQVMRVADAINYLSNNMAATAPEIMEVLRRVGGTGKLLGLTGQQVAAFGASLLALGTAPEVAATGLNALFQRLATAPAQPKAFQEALARLGLTARGLQGALRRDAAGAILDFLNRLRAAPDQLTLLTDLFGMEYADDIAKLVGSLGTLRTALGLVADPARYTGSVLQEFQNRSQTLKNQLQLLRNALERVWIVLGNALLPIVTPVVERLTGLIHRVSDLLERFPLLRGAVVGVLGVLGGLLVLGGVVVGSLAAIGFASAQARLGLLALQGAAGSLTRQLRGLSLGLALLRGEMARLGAAGLLRGALGALAQGATLAGRAVLLLGRAVLLNPLGLLLTALAGTVALFRQAWQASATFRQGVMDTLNALRGAFAPVLAELRGLGEALAGLFRPVGESLQASLAGVLPAWDRVMYALGFGLGFLFGFLRGLLRRLAPIFGEGLAGVVRVVRGFVDVVVGLLTLDLDRARQGALRVWEGLRAVLSVPIRVGGVLVDAALGALRALWEAASARFPALARLGEALSQGWQGLVRVAQAVFTDLRALFQGDFQAALGFARQGWNALQGLLSVPLRLGGVAWDAIRSGLEQALAWLRGLVDRMKQVGGQLVQGLVEGIKSWASAPVKAVENLASSVWEAIRSRLGIRSPSRVMAHLGMMAALGLAVGLQNMVPRVAQQAEVLAQAATPRLETPQVPEVPLPRLPEAALPVQVLLPEVRPPALEAVMGVRAQVPEVPLPRLPEAALPVGVEVPEVPSPPSRAPAEPPGAAPSREARQVQQVIRIERLELPGVRDAQEFLEELKRLFLPYLEA